MTSPQTNQPSSNTNEEAKIDTNAMLKANFKNWDNKALIDYAIKVTEALSEEQETVQYLTNRFDATKDWARGLALVEEIGQNLASTLDLREVLTRLLTRVYNAIDVEDGSILLVDDATGDLVSQVVLGFLAKGSQTFRVPQGHGIAGEVAATGIPLIVNNAQKDPRHFKQIDQNTGFHTRSILCVPLLIPDKIIGVLEVFNKKSGHFTKQDQVLLSSIANYAAIAIENARLHESVVAERDRVISAQEEVSRRLQRDLHDGPTQLVAAIQMGLDFCQKALEHKEIAMAESELQNLYQLSMRASHQMRTLLFELRPLILETQGLVPALETFIERRQAEIDSTKLHLVCQSNNPDNEINRLEKKSEGALFAIAQEAVNNAIKHARAKNIYIKLTQMDTRFITIIEDDGVGFDVKSVTTNYEDRGSYGMLNLKERTESVQGKYSLNSKKGEGTQIRVDIPLRIAQE